MIQQLQNAFNETLDALYDLPEDYLREGCRGMSRGSAFVIGYAMVRIICCGIRSTTLKASPSPSSGWSAAAWVTSNAASRASTPFSGDARNDAGVECEL